MLISFFNPLPTNPAIVLPKVLWYSEGNSDSRVPEAIGTGGKDGKIPFLAFVRSGAKASLNMPLCENYYTR